MSFIPGLLLSILTDFNIESCQGKVLNVLFVIFKAWVFIFSIGAIMIFFSIFVIV